MRIPTLILALFFATIKAILLPPSELKLILPAEEHAGFNIHRHSNQYEVQLEPGYSIKEHFETIGIDLGHLLKRRWHDPELGDSAAFVIHLEDEADLALVRRDSQVEWIAEAAEYSQKVIWTDELDGIIPVAIEPAEEKTGFKLHVVPDEYEIRLRSAYSTTDLWERIGKDLEHFVIRRLDAGEDGGSVTFIIRLEDEADLNLVRWRTEVARIAVVAQYSQVDFKMVEQDGTGQKFDIHDEL